MQSVTTFGSTIEVSRKYFVEMIVQHNDCQELIDFPIYNMSLVRETSLWCFKSKTKIT